MEDEDRMIKKLEEHRDFKLMVIEIGMHNNIDIRATEKNDPNGDFVYDKTQEKDLISALDEYIGDKKYVRKK